MTRFGNNIICSLKEIELDNAHRYAHARHSGSVFSGSSGGGVREHFIIA
ncbi:MAG: hypothetical protein GTO02_16945 [Candidatus Dadabacteria bacterium]|nr:hypothetical protein [Candidatus Dadabacteria bacterium]